MSSPATPSDFANSPRREFTRIRIKLPAEIQAGARVIPGASREVSMKGLFFLTEELLPVGTDCQLTLFLSEGDQKVQAQGKVVGQQPGGFAVQFDKLLGVESYEHLHNLVLYNSPETETVETEFKTHLGIRKKE